MEEKLKSVCSKCNINKWAVDYREGCYDKLSSRSVCLSCEQAALIEMQGKEIERLKAREQERDDKIRKLEDLVRKLVKPVFREEGDSAGNKVTEIDNSGDNFETKVAVVENRTEELSEIIQENRNYIVEQGTEIVEMRKEIASIKEEENFHVVRGKRSSTKTSGKEHSVALVNRFAVLADEADDMKVESYVIGDSIVREQNNHFAWKNNKKKVRSHPGCKVKKIIEEVKMLKLQDKNTCVITSVGGNDLFLRNNKVGNSEPLVKDLENLIESVAEKTDKGIVVGLMPRCNISHYAMSKAIGINNRMEKYCQEKKVEFLDVWSIFEGKWRYFRKDGIHLSELGSIKLGELLGHANNKIQRIARSSPKMPEPVPAQVQEIDNNFEGFSTGNQ